MRIGVAAALLALFAVPSAGAAREVIDADGVVYRASYAGTRYFHPLASFGKLNGDVTAGDRRGARRLASALLARATPRRDALVWEYRTPRDGRAVWTSGLAQAVAAQSLARAGRIAAARRAFRAIPAGLLIRLPQGPWIKLYGYSDLVVLNAQLQAALSIADYARRAHDPEAGRLAAALSRTAERLLPRFDTGSWSLYSLGGREETLDYHTYVTSLLWKLAARTDRPGWRARAARFRGYWRTPPRLRPGRPAPVVFPVPAEGFRDFAPISFWLSKPATVTFRIAGGRWSASFGRGWQRFDWWPQRTPPGRYVVWATAVDRAGNTATRALPAVVVERDTTAPSLSAALDGWGVRWRAHDGETPWLRLRVRLSAPGRSWSLDLGREPLAGTATLPIAPQEAWSLTLVARDSSGNATWLPLGRFGRAPDQPTDPPFGRWPSRAGTAIIAPMRRAAGDLELLHADP